MVYEEIDVFVFSIRLISNIAIIITLPLQIIIFKILWYNRRTVEYATSFHLIIRNNCIINVFQSFIRILVETPCTTDQFREQFAKHANVAGTLMFVRSYYLALLTTTNLAFVAINRVHSVFKLQVYRKTQNLLLTRHILLGIWSIWTITCLPLIWPVEFVAVKVHSVDYNYRISSTQMDIQKSYLFLSIGHSFIVLIIIYVSYIVIGIKLIQTNTLFRAKSLVNSTIASILMSLGTIIGISIVAADYIFGIFGHFFLSENYYYAIFNLGIDLNVIATPWSLLLLSHDVRKQLYNCIKKTTFINTNSKM